MEQIKFVFAKEKINEYECTRCSHLLMQAMELPCSHLFCQSCLWGWQQKEEARVPNTEEKYHCPTCQSVYIIDQIHPNAVTDRIITTSLAVKCIWHNYKCPWTGTIADYHSSHETKCKFSTVACPFKGCGQVYHRLEIDKHEESCEHRYSECRVCNVHVDWKENRRHVCVFACKNKECEEKIERKKFVEHLKNECKYTLVDCKYEKYGCAQRLPRYKMEDHRCDCSSLTFVKYDNRREDEREMKKKIKQIKEELPYLQKEFDDLETKCYALDLEWQKYEKSTIVVTLHDGKKALARFEDVKMLILENDFVTFKRYLCTCPDLYKVVDNNGDNLLHCIARENTVSAKFAFWLLEFAESGFVTSKTTSFPPLNAAQLAALNNHKNVLKVLLDHDNDNLIGCKDARNFSLLHIAVECGSLDCVQYLCTRVDIDVDCKNRDDKKADELACVTKEMKKIIKHRR